jgi:MoaA/NifB/PqqE/SkfB family radical SAM enzyme
MTIHYVQDIVVVMDIVKKEGVYVIQVFQVEIVQEQEEDKTHMEEDKTQMEEETDTEEEEIIMEEEEIDKEEEE